VSTNPRVEVRSFGKNYVSAEIFTTKFTFEVDLFMDGLLIVTKSDRTYVEGRQAHLLLGKHVKGYKELLKECLKHFSEHLKDRLEENLRRVEKVKETLT
jgi:hypothetical protein